MFNIDNIKEEIRRSVTVLLDSLQVKYDRSVFGYEIMCKRLFNVAGKMIKLKLRAVHYSKKLQDSISSSNLSARACRIIKRFDQMFTVGLDVNRLVNVNLLNENRYDQLCDCIGIKHLHMDLFIDPTQPSDKDESKIKRGNFLRVLVTDADVFFIDVVRLYDSEDKNDLGFIEILHENGWLSLVMDEVNDSCSIELQNHHPIKTADDIHCCWKNNINLSVFEFDGKHYLIKQTQAETSTEKFNQLNKFLDQMQHDAINSDSDFNFVNVRIGLFSSSLTLRSAKDHALVTYQIMND